MKKVYKIFLKKFIKYFYLLKKLKLLFIQKRSVFIQKRSIFILFLEVNFWPQNESLFDPKTGRFLIPFLKLVFLCLPLTKLVKNESIFASFLEVDFWTQNGRFLTTFLNPFFWSIFYRFFNYWKHFWINFIKYFWKIKFKK